MTATAIERCWEEIESLAPPLAPLLRDDTVSEILVNWDGCTFVERNGVLEPVGELCGACVDLEGIVRRIGRYLGREVSEDQPLLECRLPDGSRVAAVFPPASVGGVTLSIRRLRFDRHRWEDLYGLGTVNKEQGQMLLSAMYNRENVLIFGSTGAGKTTLLNALLRCISRHERLVVIEDVREIRVLDHPNVVYLEVSAGASIRDLLKAALRQRPDRIIIGEVRGAEAFDLIDALNTGHSGSISTIHANNVAQVHKRLFRCVSQAYQMPYDLVREMIDDAFQWFVHIARVDGKRVVTEVKKNAE